MSFENYDPCFPDQLVVDLYLPIWAKLPSFKSKPAFIWVEDGDDGNNTPCSTSLITYGQLNESVHSISSHLLLPLQRGDTVLILCQPGLELVEIIFGCQRAGLLAVPMFIPSNSFAKDGYHHLVRAISQTKPKAAIADPGFVERVNQYTNNNSNNNKQLSQWLQKLRWISTEEIIVRGEEVDLSSKYRGCRPEETYLIQYTSGATGIPKPVLVTAGAAAHNVRAARKAYDLNPNSVIVSWLPQYHDCGLMFLLLTIVSGATSVLTSPATFIKRPWIWLELMTEYKATCTPVPSFTLPLVVRRGGGGGGGIISRTQGTIPVINLSTMKNLIIINEPIYKNDIDEFVKVFSTFGLNPLSISPSYGLAENCTFVSTAWRSGTRITTTSLPTYGKLLPSARLDSPEEGEEEDIIILVVNEETKEPVEDGIEGEIWISSPSNASGYLGHPFLTRDVFEGMLCNRVSPSFVRTGDRGIVVGKERYLYVTGRISDILKLKNDQLELHPHFIETAAYNSCPQKLRGGCLAAFVVSRTIAIVAEMQKKEGEEEEERVLRNICETIRKAVMEEEGVRIGLVVLVKSGSVPKTTSGKIQRWLAKDKLMRGNMNTVMQMKFQDHDRDLGILNSMNHANVKGKQDTYSGKTRTYKVVAEDTEDILLSISNAPTHLSLLSSL